MEVLYEDAHLIAVNKPGGLAVQADKTGDPFLLQRLPERFSGEHALGLPHRLDRPVSGVVLVTRSHEALTAMSRLFADRAIDKTYWAIVSGTPESSGSWEHRLLHDAHHHKARIVQDASVELSRVAFKRIAVGDRYSLIELVPEGGGFHQLRAQCAAAGFPIKGDVKYGARRGEKDRTIGLHARSIAFTHPFTRSPLHLVATAPVAAVWEALLNIASDPGVTAS